MKKNIEYGFMAMIGMSSYLWFKGGQVNNAQIYFRLGISFVGIVGLLLTKYLSSKTKQNS